jgi:anti-sigma factor RsiW
MYNPLLIFERHTGCLLAARLRPGRVVSHARIISLLLRIVPRLQREFPKARIKSTDQHTVKPWSDGKIAFSPPVSDFGAQDFPLVGGRLDVFQGRTVAALVYGRGKHFISVFIWPDVTQDMEQYAGTMNGYQWISWKHTGLRFCAVADTNRGDLAALKDLFNR